MPKKLLILLLPPLLTACTSLQYYTQAIGGHLDILSKREPIEDLLRDPSVSGELKSKLRLALDARRFATDELGLPDGGSYRDYADLRRPYVVWNVVAAPRLSVEPVRSCFFVVGCLSYRGYFSRDDAQEAADRMAAQGYDVYVAGVTAYSTLGWFDDPLLSTLLRGSSDRMIATLFHELAHQRLYVKGASEFNEAFAVAVAQEGMRRWYESTGQPDLYAGYVSAVARRRQFYRLLGETRKELDELYRSERSEPEKLRAKASVLARMRERYQSLKSSWGDYRGFDAWMEQDLNNAHLALIATYHELVPAFRVLLERRDGEMKRFYVAARELGSLSEAERANRMETLAAEADLLSPDGRLALDSEGENPLN